jgi:hypothetical protein
MNRVLTTVLAVALLLGLGALAVLALPGASTPLAAAPFVSAAPLAPGQPEAVTAPDVTLKYNVIALPLDAKASIPNAAALVDYLNRAEVGQPKTVDQVLHWDAAAQDFTDYYLPNLGPLGTNFSLEVGGTYWILLDSTAPPVFSVVGDVPQVGELQYNLLGATPNCAYNNIIIPLDQWDAAITHASDLVTAMGGPTVVDQVLQWSAADQDFVDYWLPNIPIGTDFSVQPGYPYMVCLKANITWPN